MVPLTTKIHKRVVLRSSALQKIGVEFPQRLDLVGGAVHLDAHQPDRDVVLLVVWEQQPADARTAAIAGNGETALVGRTVVEADGDGPVLARLDIVRCLVPLQHRTTATQRPPSQQTGSQATRSPGTNTDTHTEKPRKSQVTHAWMSSPVASSRRNRSRVTLMRSDSAAGGVLALSSPVERSKNGKAEGRPARTAARST